MKHRDHHRVTPIPIELHHILMISQYISTSRSPLNPALGEPVAIPIDWVNQAGREQVRVNLGEGWLAVFVEIKHGGNPKLIGFMKFYGKSCLKSKVYMKVFIETSSIIGPLSIAKFDYPSLIGYVTTNVIHSSYPPKLQFGPSSDTKNIGGLVATQLVCSIFHRASWSPTIVVPCCTNSCDHLQTFLTRPHWNPKKAILFLSLPWTSSAAIVLLQSPSLAAHQTEGFLVSNHIKPTWP